MSKVRYGLGLTGAALACAIAGFGAPANAQAPATMPPAPFAGAEPIVAFGQDMAAKGIFFQLGYDEQIMSLVSGGIKNGTMPAGQADFGAIFDLETMFGLPGASFHIHFDERNGIEAVNSISGSNVFFQSDSEGLAFNMSEFYWEQGFDNDRLDILIGRTQPTFDFMLWDVSCAGVSSIQCAQMGSFYPSQNSHPFGFSQWGARVNFQITPEIYVRGGIYNERPDDGDFHANGFTWRFSPNVGALIPIQVGYQTSFASAAYPGYYDIGGYKDTAAYNTLVGNLQNGITATGSENRGRTAFWAQAEQTVWRPDRKTNQSLTAFAAMIAYSGGGPFWSQYSAGLYDRAPFGPARPTDSVLALMSLYQANFGNLYAGDSVAFTSQAQLKSMWAFELAYNFTIMPGITLTPAFQYVLNPDNPAGVTNSSGSFRIKDDISIGFAININPAAMFGFPVWAPH